MKGTTLQPPIWLSAVFLKSSQKKLPVFRGSFPETFWKSLISIITALHVCQWMTVTLALCFKHEPVILYVTAHHNLWTMPLPVSMKKTVRRFNGREIKQTNNSHYRKLLINWSFDTSRGLPFSFPPCFLFDSPLNGHFITRTSWLMHLTPPDSESGLCDSLCRLTEHANGVERFTYCPAKPVGSTCVTKLCNPVKFCTSFYLRILTRRILFGASSCYRVSKCGNVHTVTHGGRPSDLKMDISDH